MGKAALNERVVNMAGSRWTFAVPLKNRPIDDDGTLIIHPPSGSWVIARPAELHIIAGLMQAAASGVLDEVPGVEQSPIVERLHAAGLLLRDGLGPAGATQFDNGRNAVSMLILKMVGHCNLACTYCYDYNSTTYRRRMDVDSAEEAIGQTLLRSGGTLNVLFHGGEPLLAFPEIRRLVAFARERAAVLGKSVDFSIQTNGTRFTDEVVEFLTNERFSIGISLDGPEGENDISRVDHAGRGSYAVVMEGLRRFPALRAKGGVLTTVTRENVGQLLAIARHFRDLGVPRWDTTVFQPDGRGDGQHDRFAPEASRLVGAYLELLDAVDSGEFDSMEVRPVLHYVRNALSHKRRNMCLRDSCGAASNLVSVSVDGTIEACDCIKNTKLRLGSMKAGGVGGALDSPVAQQIRARNTAALVPCVSCDWRVLCGGTCLAKAGELGDVDPTECELSMAIFPDIFRRLARGDGLTRYAKLFP